MKKRKTTKPVQSKEQQAASDGWIYVSTSKTIRGWNSVWVEGARVAGLDVVVETTLRL